MADDSVLIHIKLKRIHMRHGNASTQRSAHTLLDVAINLDCVMPSWPIAAQLAALSRTSSGHRPIG
eukprot:3309899-Pleurochrysis_carterae.AAC.1